MNNWKDIKQEVYEKIESILKFYLYESYTDEIHDEIINKCESLIKPYLEDKTLHDARFVLEFDEKKNSLILSFGWKTEEGKEFTLATVEICPTGCSFEDAFGEEQ